MTVSSCVDYLVRALRAVVHAFMDDSCVSCGCSGGRLCDACTLLLPRVEGRCVGCARYMWRTCRSCAGRWSLDGVLASHPYGHRTIRSLVKTFKYRLEYGLADRLAASMTAVLRTRTFSRPLIVPVPLHTNRRRWRGFDQASSLARSVSGRTLFEYADALERTRQTPQQAKAAGRAVRLATMHGAFRVRDTEHVSGRDIILIDDVCTTGATLDACASTLKDAGAASVTALVFARS